MKVLHIIDSLSLGGAETLLKAMLPLMKKKTVESTVLILKRDVDHDDLDFKKLKIDVYETGLRSVYTPLQIFSIASFLKKNSFDLVHVHLFPAQYWYAFATYFSNSKYPAITTEHSSFNKRRNKTFYKVIEALIYRKYDQIICISNTAKEAFVQWQPSLKYKVKMIHNGIDLKKYSTAKAYDRRSMIPGIKSSSKLILMVASFTPKKDHQTLFEAAKLLPNHYEFVLVGEGPLKNYYNKMIENNGLSDRIHFMGYRFDVERIIKSVDLFVHSSHWEGFGLVAVEAMAGGLPVVVSNVPGLKEIVGDTGLYFNPGNADELATLIMEVMKSKSKYEELSKQSLEYAKTFDLNLTVDKYIEVYKSLIGNIKGVN